MIIKQKKNRLNANNYQMDVRTATDTGDWKLGDGSVVVDSLLLPLFVGVLCFVLVLLYIT